MMTAESAPAAGAGAATAASAVMSVRKTARRHSGRPVSSLGIVAVGRAVGAEVAVSPFCHTRDANVTVGRRAAQARPLRATGRGLRQHRLRQLAVGDERIAAAVV